MAEVYSSPQEISTAISLGVLQWNQGFGCTYTDLLPSLDINANAEMVEMWHNIDDERIYQAEYRDSAEIKTKRKKKRKEKLKKQDAFVHQEGVMYKSQAFHGGKDKSVQGQKKKQTGGQKVQKGTRKRKSTKK